MANITVTVRDVTGAKHFTVSLPADVPVRRWMSTLITKLGLPTQQADGRLVSYTLHHKQSGKTLAEDDTLSGAGVAENDVIQLVPEVTAGASNPRLRRLQADWQKVVELSQRSTLIEVESTTGTPPETYVIRYFCKGISHLRDGKPVYSRNHRIQIVLPADYPFARSGQLPLARYIEGRAWHPNVYADGTVCYGKWHVGMSLDELLLEIGEIIQYRNCSLRDAANLEAARWAAEHMGLIPVDKSPLLDRDDGSLIRVIGDDSDRPDVIILDRPSQPGNASRPRSTRKGR
jgi:ubiquitin-protein ligase